MTEQERQQETMRRYEAQKEYCSEHLYPLFAPINCYRCKRNIFEDADIERTDWRSGKKTILHKEGISFEKASSELITGCPHCNWSFCE